MLRLVLLRHGNTFAPGDKVVMIGAREDLPLVPSGIAQAEAMAHALRALKADAVYAAPLQRTRAYAEIVGRATKSSVTLEPRLAELDYGAWAGKSDAEIEAQGAGDALRAWRDRGAWPAGLSESEAQAVARVHGFARSIVERQGTVVVVTSQGILRLLARLAPSSHDRLAAAHKLAVKTGHGCVMTYDGGFAIPQWNLGPAALADAL